MFVIMCVCVRACCGLAVHMVFRSWPLLRVLSMFTLVREVYRQIVPILYTKRRCFACHMIEHLIFNRYTTSVTIPDSVF
jgi:hypothetical protein